MPKISQNAFEQSTGSPVSEVVSANPGLTLSTNPVLVCGVNRKVNIGNFENIDIYAGISLPLGDISLEDKEALTKAIEEAAAYGFSLISKETGDRYSLIKESQQGKA
jgi:hypothetical protein